MAVPVFRGADRILGAVNQLAIHNERERLREEQERREREQRRSNRFGMIGGALGAIGGAALAGPMGASAGYGLGSMFGQAYAGNPPGPEQTLPTVINAAGAIDTYQQRQQQQAARQQIIGAMAPPPVGPPPMIAAPPPSAQVATDQFGVPQFDKPLVQPQGAANAMTPQQYDAAVKRNQLMRGLMDAGYGAEVAGALVKQMFPGAANAEGFTLSPGQTRFGPGGQPIANLPAAPSSGSAPINASAPAIYDRETKQFIPNPHYVPPEGSSSQQAVGGRPVAKFGERWFYTDRVDPKTGQLAPVPLPQAPGEDESWLVPNAEGGGYGIEYSDTRPTGGIKVSDWETFNKANAETDDDFVVLNENGSPQSTAATYKAALKAADNNADRVVARDALLAANAPLSSETEEKSRVTERGQDMSAVNTAVQAATTQRGQDMTSATATANREAQNARAEADRESRETIAELSRDAQNKRSQKALDLAREKMLAQENARKALAEQRAEQRATSLENDLRKDFRQRNPDYLEALDSVRANEEMRDYYQGLGYDLTNDTEPQLTEEQRQVVGFADSGLIYNFARAKNGGRLAKDDVEFFLNGEGVPAWIAKSFNRIARGDRLTNNERRTLLDLTEREMKARQQRYDETAREFTLRASRDGLDPRNVILDENYWSRVQPQGAASGTPALGAIRPADKPVGAATPPAYNPASPPVVTPPTQPSQWTADDVANVPISALTEDNISKVLDPAVLDAIENRLMGL